MYRPVNVFAYVHAFVFVCMFGRFFPLYGHVLIPDPHVRMPTFVQTYMHTCIHTYIPHRFCGRHGPRTILELLTKRGYKIDMFSTFPEEKEVCALRPEAIILVVSLSLSLSLSFCHFVSLSLSLPLSLISSLSLSLSLSLSHSLFLSLCLPLPACLCM